MKLDGRVESMANLQIKGMDDFDLIIALCAMTNNLTLVTNNTKHFSSFLYRTKVQYHSPF